MTVPPHSGGTVCFFLPPCAFAACVMFLQCVRLRPRVYMLFHTGMQISVRPCLAYFTIFIYLCIRYGLPV